MTPLLHYGLCSVSIHKLSPPRESQQMGSVFMQCYQRIQVAQKSDMGAASSCSHVFLRARLHAGAFR